MMTRYRVALDGQHLHIIAPEIYVIDISYSAPVRNITTTPLAGGHGQRITNDRTGSTGVVVTFEIHSRDVARRRQICQLVQSWAMRGGWLTTSDIPNQRLRVMCEQMPTIGSALKWTQRLTIGFTAYERPFWEDIRPKKVTINGNGSQSVYAPGLSMPATVSGVLTNTGGTTITSVTLTAGDTAWNLTGLFLAPGKQLIFAYDNRGILHILADGQSTLGNRSASSSDELLLEPGRTQTLSVTTDGTAQTVFEVRGRYP